MMGKSFETRNFSWADTNIKLAEDVAKVNCLFSFSFLKNFPFIHSISYALFLLDIQAAKEAGVERLIHISALGADPKSPSKFLATKVLRHLSSHIEASSRSHVFISVGGVFFFFFFLMFLSGFG